MNNVINVYQMQCDNIRKQENDRGMIVAQKYDLRCRSIAYGVVKPDISITNKESIADQAWRACNVKCWDGEYKTGERIETDLATIFPTEHFKGFCGSDVFVMCHNKIYVADSFGWTVAENVEEAISRIIFFYPGIKWDEILNKENFTYYDHYWVKLRKEQNEKLIFNPRIKRGRK